MLIITFPVVVMVDVADKWMCSRLDFEVLKCLAQHPDIPAVLVLNKVLFAGVKCACFAWFIKAETTRQEEI